MINAKKMFVLTLLMSLLVLAALNASAINVKAQGQATVAIADSVGGTTSPAAGTTSYDDGASVTLTATSAADFAFNSWVIDVTGGSNIISGDNPFTFNVTGGNTYTVQATFNPFLSPPGVVGSSPLDTTKDAVVLVLAASGGTTTPGPGLYYFTDATSLNLMATASSGWQFSHWVISGPNLNHGGYPFTATPTDNPYNVNHGYGYTYSYQPVFTPIGSTEPTPVGATPTPSGTIGGLSTDTAIEIGLVVVIIIILIAFGVFASRRKK
jgi:hypothetical protein